METPIAPIWLRCTSAILTAWCAFWGSLGALSNLAIYVVLWDVVEIGDPGRVGGYIYSGLFLLGACLVSFFTTRWQWTCMRSARSGDHWKLVILLLVLGIAVTSQPFVYASF